MLRQLSTLALAGLLALAAQAGDPRRGQLLGLSCTACHGTGGKSPGAIPSIGGRDAGELLKAMHGFRDGSRPATVMDRIAKGYSDEELAALAAYYASLAN